MQQDAAKDYGTATGSERGALFPIWKKYVILI